MGSRTHCPALTKGQHLVQLRAGPFTTTGELVSSRLWLQRSYHLRSTNPQPALFITFDLLERRSGERLEICFPLQLFDRPKKGKKVDQTSRNSLGILAHPRLVLPHFFFHLAHDLLRGATTSAIRLFRGLTLGMVPRGERRVAPSVIAALTSLVHDRQSAADDERDDDNDRY